MTNQTTRNINLNQKSVYKRTSKKNSSIPNISTNLLKTFMKHTLIYTQRKNSRAIKVNNPPRLKQNLSKRVYFADVNSLYPFCFINKLPTITRGKGKTDLLIVAQVTKPNFERLPFKPTELTPRLSLLTRKEVEYLKHLKFLVVPLYKLPIQYSTNLLIDPILHIYKQKTGKKKLIKLILNSIYGKLLVPKNNSDYHYLLTTTMLSYAKIMAHRLQNIPNNPSNYSDTDSICTRHPHQAELSLNIGHLKELDFIDRFSAKKPRIYTYTHIHSKLIVNKGEYIHSYTHTWPKNSISITKLVII